MREAFDGVVEQARRRARRHISLPNKALQRLHQGGGDILHDHGMLKIGLGEHWGATLGVGEREAQEHPLWLWPSN
ncbi:hypothetical protein BKE38_14890 [Pseudoroseomonas deserti]|uniref:Uncharacterized protein n=1 Tax=Teichococcus deserti TaxID=1817963 RepID=A0A1V2H1F3_9PROT|nr:hypothetical protein BKE38_14890 [Pseudoroseomonas deserti]